MAEFEDDKHPRDEHGRFAGGLEKFAAKYSKRLADPLLKQAEKSGGFTYKPDAPKKERTPTTGYMVSSDTKDKLGHVIEIAKMADRDPPPTTAQVRDEVKGQVQKWLAGAMKNIKGKEGAYLGGYIETDEKTGHTVALHLDVSHHFKPEHKERAITEGRARNQISIWDIAKKEEIKTGGTGR